MKDRQFGEILIFNKSSQIEVLFSKGLSCLIKGRVAQLDRASAF